MAGPSLGCRIQSAFVALGGSCGGKEAVQSLWKAPESQWRPVWLWRWSRGMPSAVGTVHLLRNNSCMLVGLFGDGGPDDGTLRSPLGQTSPHPDTRCHCRTRKPNLKPSLTFD